MFDAHQYRAIEWAGNTLRHYAHRRRPPAHEPLSNRVRLIIQPLNDGEHCRALFGRNRHIAIQHPRNGARRYLGFARDIVDGDGITHGFTIIHLVKTMSTYVFSLLRQIRDWIKHGLDRWPMTNYTFLKPISSRDSLLERLQRHFWITLGLLQPKLDLLAQISPN